MCTLETTFRVNLVISCDIIYIGAPVLTLISVVLIQG